MLRPFCASRDYVNRCWKELETLYTAPSRQYHTLTHISHLLTELRHSGLSAQNEAALSFSIYYHDSIYVAGRKDNERNSALLLKNRLGITTFPFVALCMAQINSTKDHLPSGDKDTQLLLDLDLTVLGQPPEQYQRYVENIRAEFGQFPDFLFRRGRAKFIKGMLRREQIYNTAYFFSTYEVQARANLTAELELLQK